MTDEEKFSFDLEGYLVVRNVLDAGDLTRLNAAAEQAVPDWGDSGISTAGRVSQWGPDFQALMDHDTIVPYLVELLGPKFRIDHDYCIFMKRGATRGGLHGGEKDSEADHWYKYRDGVMRNGLTVVTYFLHPQGPVTADSPASPEAINPTSSTGCRGTFGASNATPITWCSPMWMPVTPSFLRRRSSTAQSPGRPTTIAAPCSTSTVPGTRPGHRDITTPRNTRT